MQMMSNFSCNAKLSSTFYFLSRRGRLSVFLCTVMTICLEREFAIFVQLGLPILQSTNFYILHHVSVFY